MAFSRSLVIFGLLGLARVVAAQDEPVPAQSQAERDKIAVFGERPLSAVKVALRTPPGELPVNRAAVVLARETAEFPGQPAGRSGTLVEKQWAAPALRHLPLYFEEPNLERLGWEYRLCADPYDTCDAATDQSWIQPIVSAGRFFGRIPMLPYMMGYQSPHEPVYELGQVRPGSPHCYQKTLLPISPRGALYQAGSATGMAFIIP